MFDFEKMPIFWVQTNSIQATNPNVLWSCGGGGFNDIFPNMIGYTWKQIIWQGKDPGTTTNPQEATLFSGL